MALWFVCCGPLAADESARVSFSREIQPILSNKCYFCHGPDEGKREAHLRLDTFEGATARLKDSDGSALVPGKTEASVMLKRMRSTDPEVVMPPPKSHLTMLPEEIALIERWIEQGAEYERHWAFIAAPDHVSVPQVRGASWPVNPIDSFVLALLEKETLQPSKEAPPERWLRRVTYDLTGLPPTQAEMDDFMAAPSAREAVVDRLFASPRFGEHMATAWLDVARYADSFGYQADIATNAWPYRDWVIRAFNDNLPFDDFIIHQLAGDLLPNATRDQKLATAFNRIHRKTNEGGSVPEEFRQDGISDRVHTIGTAFMALTMECARCHDHKYDPISMKDYYAMGAFFNSIDEFGLIQGGKDRGVVLPQPALQLPTPEQESTLTHLLNAIADAEAKLHEHLAQPADAAAETKAQEYPSPDLVARYRFDEKDGNTLVNDVDSEKPAKIGGNRLIPGKSGNGILADGDSLTSLPSFDISHADQPFSISFWLKPGEAHSRAVVFANTSSFDVPFSGYELLLEDGHVTWTLAREQPGCAASVSTVATIPVGEWTHIAVTNDGSRRAAGLMIYLNGQPAGTTVIHDNLSRNFNIGGGLNFMARGRDIGMRGGMVDEITIHRRAISALEVKSIYQNSPIDRTEATPEQLAEYHRSAVDPEARRLRAALDAARAAYRSEESKVQEIVTMRESAHPVPAFILARGDYTSPTDRVERETPSWLPPFPENEPRNRLGFARWLVSPEHPLTARVTVNRLWQQLFGRGLAASSDNFGLQGTRPSHPDLLDWLARDFINSGWDHKRMMKQIVLSATYAQDSMTSPALRERDPDNTLLARGPARRLSAEQLRDSALALSGLLSDTIGGPPAKPYQAPGSMWKTLNNFLPEYKPDKGEGLYRRSLYTFWRRTTTPPNMMAFDAGTRDVCSTRRQTTNTPLQALVLLNDVQFVEAARKFGERILKHGGSDDESRAAWSWREVIGKPPSAAQAQYLVGNRARPTAAIPSQSRKRPSPPQVRRLASRSHPRSRRSRHLHHPRPSPAQPRRAHLPSLNQYHVFIHPTCPHRSLHHAHGHRSRYGQPRAGGLSQTLFQTALHGQELRYMA